MGIAGLIKFALVILAGWLLYRGIKSLMGGGSHSQGKVRRNEDPEVIDVMVKDPQCGTYLPREQALRARAFGQDHFFCSEACRDAFIKGGGPQKDGPEKG